VQHLHRLLPGRVRSVLDWFHISMRIRYLEQIVSGLRAGSATESQAKRLLANDVSKLRWHFWHASFEKAEAKLRRIVTVCRVVVAETSGFESRLKHLDWRVREFFDYLDNNKARSSTTACGTVQASRSRPRWRNRRSTRWSTRECANASRCGGRLEVRTCWRRCAAQ
jgi:hypothetical protein